ncbi:MAG: DUF1700 domain-containing protein [Clostridiales bacterium]|nr:DUF1700 domain-containing protein [Clostridiales bacterium]
MNKREYVSALRAQLKTLPSNDVEEIAKEFEAHFDIGVSEGKTEEEIAAKLGSPEEVAQIYLSDTVPGFDVAAAANAANAPQFPIIPIKTGWVLGRGVGPQTIAGFCDPASAKPVVNSAPKKEPEGYKFAHTGAKEREEYVNVGPQGKKQVDLPDYSMYPAQDPNRQRSEKKEHNLAFAILFTIFVFIPVWLIALAVLLLLIATPILTGVIAGVLFCWAASLSTAVAGTICLGISLVFAAIAELFVAYFAAKGFILGTIAYFRYIFKINGNSAKGGNA